MKTKLDEMLILANRGRAIWEGVIDNDTSDLILLFTQSTNDFLKNSIQLFLKSKGGKKITILTTSKQYDYLYSQLNNECDWEILDDCEIESIIMLNNLYMFNEKLIIVSKFYPNNRTAYNLSENGLLSVEDYIEKGVFKILEGN